MEKYIKKNESERAPRFAAKCADVVMANRVVAQTKEREGVGLVMSPAPLSPLQIHK